MTTRISYAPLSIGLAAGFGGGIILGSFYGASLWVWNALSAEGIKSSDISTLFAGILGAAVGGAISWIITRQTANETLRRDNEQRTAALELAALKTLMKLQRLGNGYHTHKLYFWEQLEEANQRGNFNLPMWRKIKAQAGSDVSSIAFDSEDFVPLQRVGKVSLINDCALLAERFAVIERSVLEYNRQRRVVEDLLADFTEVREDGMFVTNVPKALENRIKLKGEILEGFVRNIYRDITADDIKTKALCEEVSFAFVNYFKDEAKFRLEFTE